MWEYFFPIIKFCNNTDVSLSNSSTISHFFSLKGLFEKINLNIELFNFGLSKKIKVIIPLFFSNLILNSSLSKLNFLFKKRFNGVWFSGKLFVCFNFLSCTVNQKPLEVIRRLSGF